MYLMYLRGEIRFLAQLFILRSVTMIVGGSISFDLVFYPISNLLLHLYLLIHVFFIELSHFAYITINKLSLMFFTR